MTARQGWTVPVRYEDFRRLATTHGLSPHERIGFPDSYRDGFGAAIVRDIRAKLPRLDQPGARVLDIGPGCSELPGLLIDLCRRLDHHLTLVDSEEMLAHLPEAPFIERIAGPFPEACWDAFDTRRGTWDVILAYSVAQYVHVDSDLRAFVTRTAELLAEGGRALLGDIPNVSKRARFLQSSAGRNFLAANPDGPEAPAAPRAEPVIDDDLLLELIHLVRDAGFDAYLVPQASDLPMANRREDLLICRA
jgi:2-polyprenyl-3-methyl-5-hydroxy-6-metoxy-1,4-benzoquinol methylase